VVEATKSGCRGNGSTNKKEDAISGLSLGGFFKKFGGKLIPF
jgi:hypothetical protein